MSFFGSKYANLSELMNSAEGKKRKQDWDKEDHSDSNFFSQVSSGFGEDLSNIEDNLKQGNLWGALRSGFSASGLYGGNTQNALLGRTGEDNPGAASADPAATPEEVAQDALNKERNDLKRKRASSTLFTGGAGTLDAPSVASSVLLGS